MASLKVVQAGQRRPGGARETSNTYVSVVSAYAPTAKAPSGIKVYKRAPGCFGLCADELHPDCVGGFQCPGGERRESMIYRKGCEGDME